VLHGQEIKFFSGASEAIGILRLLGKEELLPGDEAWIQLELREPVVVVRGDHYILQRPSPGETLGGGIIVDHNPKGRHKRFDEKVLAPLESILKGSPSNVLFESAMATKVGVIREIVINSRLEPADAESALRELVANGSIICLEDGKLTHDGDLLATPLPEWTLIKGKTLKFIDKYHAEYPLRRGIPREELKSRLKLSPRVFAAVVRKLIIEELITDNNSSLARAGFEIRFNEQEQAKVQALMRKFDANSFAPPSVKDCQSEVGMEIFNSLVESGTFVTVSPDVVFRKQDYDLMMAEVRKLLAQKEKVALSEVRDQFNTSRKYAQAFLEHLDSMGVTQRDGDFRKLRT
jgi:selenocysteine-specific elongation factor